MAYESFRVRQVENFDFNAATVKQEYSPKVAFTYFHIKSIFIHYTFDSTVPNIPLNHSYDTGLQIFDVAVSCFIFPAAKKYFADTAACGE